MKQSQLSHLYMLAFPAVLALGIILIPVVMDYSDHELASQAVQMTGRWFAGHIIAAIAFALSILSVCTIERNLLAVSKSLPGITLPFIVVGAGLYSAGLGADGIGPIALQSANTSPEIFFDGSAAWVPAVFISGTIAFGIGLITLVGSLIRQGILTGASRYVTFIAALVFMSAPAIPSGWALYGEAIAAILVFIPIGSAISSQNSAP